MQLAEIQSAVDTAVKQLRNPGAHKSDDGTIEALKAIGFTKSVNVADVKDHNSHYKAAASFYDSYPIYKFITNHQLTKLQNRFKLVRGPIDQFKGSIPDKNIKELCQAKIDFGDINWNATDKVSQVAELVADALFGKKPSVKDSIFGSDMDFLSSFMDRDKRPRESFSDFVRNKERSGRYRESDSLTLAQMFKENPAVLTIVAGAEAFEKDVPESCPIVAVAVNGGFLIVTAWGDGAQDPDVANARMNLF
jgi:hypothetical protein